MHSTAEPRREGSVAAQSPWSFSAGQVLHHVSPGRQEGFVHNEEGKNILKSTNGSIEIMCSSFSDSVLSIV